MNTEKSDNNLIDQNTIDKMVERLAQKMLPEKIYLFGSYAWGKPTSKSDIDLCIVFEDIKPKDVLSMMIEANRVLKDFEEISCDVIVRNSDKMERLRPYHAPLESKILRKGKLLYESTIT